MDYKTIITVKDDLLVVNSNLAPSYEVTVEYDSNNIPGFVTTTATSKKEPTKKITYRQYCHCPVRFAQFLASMTDLLWTEALKKK